MDNNELIDFILNDNRNCRSRNMQAFFRNKRNRHQTSVIRFEEQLWFVSFGWPPGDNFSGVRVVEVACQGMQATSGYPYRQKPGSWTDVTDWFWKEYKEAGVVAFPEIWHIKLPVSLLHKEAHSI